MIGEGSHLLGKHKKREERIWGSNLSDLKSLKDLEI